MMMFRAMLDCNATLIELLVHQRGERLLGRHANMITTPTTCHKLVRAARPSMERAPLTAVYCAAPAAVGTKQGPILVIFLSVQRAMHVLARPRPRPGLLFAQTWPCSLSGELHGVRYSDWESELYLDHDSLLRNYQQMQFPHLPLSSSLFLSVSLAWTCQGCEVACRSRSEVNKTRQTIKFVLSGIFSLQFPE